MTWTASFVSPAGTFIADGFPNIAGDAEKYDDDIRVAIEAADALVPNNEENEQTVRLSGYRGENTYPQEHVVVSFTVQVTQNK